MKTELRPLGAGLYVRVLAWTAALSVSAYALCWLVGLPSPAESLVGVLLALLFAKRILFKAS